MSLVELTLPIAARTQILAVVPSLAGKVHLSRMRPVSSYPLVTVATVDSSGDYLGKPAARYTGPVGLLITMYASSTAATDVGGDTVGPDADLESSLCAIDFAIRTALLAHPRVWLPAACARVESYSARTQTNVEGEGGALVRVRELRLSVTAEQPYAYDIGTPIPLDLVVVDYHHSGDEDPDYSANIEVEQDD